MGMTCTVADEIRKVTFPVLVGDPRLVTYPFHFEPGGDQTPGAP
jgi:hypothetical protein